MEKHYLELLSEEYSNSLNHFILWPLKITGYTRFETDNGRFVEKKRSTVIRSIVFLILVNLSAAYIIFITAYVDKYITVIEIIIVVVFILVHNMILVNITFSNKNEGIGIINTFIKIDSTLGVEEAKFMREISARTFRALCYFFIFCQITAGIGLYFAYSVSVAIHVVGTIFFFNAFLIPFDTCFLITFLNILSLRVHYLNLALINFAKLNPMYFANQFFFNRLLWKKRFDKMVTFHDRADDTQFIQLFELIFQQLRRLEKSYRFIIFVFMTSMIFLTFMAVQAIIIHKNYPDVHVLRTIAVASWPPTGWVYIILFSQPVDILYRHLEKTKLICTYIQLKPMMSPRLLKLSKQILATLAVHEPRLSIYDVYFFNTTAVFHTIASILVFVTVQLQLAAPATHLVEQSLVNLTNDVNDDALWNTMLFR